MRIEDVLLPALLAQISRPAADWLSAARERAASGAVPELLRSYTEASRYLGTQRFALRPPMASPGEAGDWNHLTLEDVGRLLLLTARSQSPADDAAAIECFEQGDTREQQSWMRTVAWLPQPERFLPIVIDTCRTNILPLFEAVACENLYPATYFPERNLNQVVLKALFNRIALTRIVGLDRRRNAELSRMAADYAAERRAAGRSVPEDIALAMLDAAAQRTHA